MSHLRIFALSSSSITKMKLGALFFLAAAVSAQAPSITPPLFGNGFCCSWISQAQAGDLRPDCGAPVCAESQYLFDPNEIWMSGYCAALYVQASTSPLVGFKVRQGGSVYWQAAMDDGNEGYLTCAAFSPWYALSFLAPGSVTVPGAAQGWDQLFGQPVDLFLPTHYLINWPNQAFESWILEMPIPVNPALDGMFVQCQAVVPDFNSGLLRLSSAMITQIGS